jgi:DNA-binding Lrp family transcriptional regulator
MKAYVLIKVATGEIPAAVQSLRQSKNVLEANMTFGPFDVIAVIEAENLKELGRVVSFSIQCIPGVLETLTCLLVDV